MNASGKYGTEDLLCQALSRCCVCVLSHVQCFAALRTIAHQILLPVACSRQDWSGVSFPLPRDLPDLGIETSSLGPPALASGFFSFFLMCLIFGSAELCCRAGFSPGVMLRLFIAVTSLVAGHGL